MAHRRAMARITLVDVLEDDDVALDAGRSGPEGAGGMPGGGGRRRKAPLWVAGVVVGVLVAAGATQGVLSARERSALAALAQVPGVLEPAGRTLTIKAHYAPDDAAALFDKVGGALTFGADGSQTFSRLNAAGTGATWSTQIAGPDAAVAAVDTSHLMSASSCADGGDEAAEGPRVVCLVADGGTVIPDDGGAVTTLPTTTHEIVVLDATTGDIVARWSPEPAQAMTVLPHDLVVLEHASEAGTTVTGHDALSGAERWVYREPPDPRAGLDTVGVVRAGDLIGIGTASRLRLLSAEGTVVREVSAAAGGLVWSSPGQPLTVQEPTGTGGTRTTFIAADGAAAKDVTVPGKPVSVAVDDGSVPGLLLSEDHLAYASDSVTGKLRWSADVLGAFDAAVVRGRVFLVSPRGVFAFDGDSGKQLWTVPTVDVGPRAVMTDGRHILVPYEGTTVSDVHALVAFDPVSGHEDFRVAYPTGLRDLQQAGDRMVATETATNDWVVLG